MTDDRSVAPRICPCCGLPKWPGREDFSRMSAEQINAYLAGTGNDVRVMPDAAAPDELRALAHKAEEYIEAVVSYLDDANQFTHSRRRHVDRTGEELAEIVAAALRPAGAPEPGEFIAEDGTVVPHAAITESWERG